MSLINGVLGGDLMIDFKNELEKFKKVHEINENTEKSDDDEIEDIMDLLSQITKHVNVADKE